MSIKEKQTNQPFRKKTFFLWLSLIIIALSLYHFDDSFFSLNLLKAFVAQHKALVCCAYLLLLSLLGLAFLPSTPFAIGSVLLFSPEEAYLLNLIGILSSSTIVYHFSQFLGLHTVFHAKYPQQIEKAQAALNKHAFPVIIGWSFFPVVPTDVIIYVSGTLNIPFWKCLVGVMLGESALNACYIFSIDWLWMAV